MALASSQPLKYRAYVDGLRAVAVLPVLFFHANLGFTGGYVGVDIFFVISGYLITGLILKDLAAGQFHLVRFWERRVRRILPAIAVVVLASLAAGWFLLLPQAFKELGESTAAQTLLVSNLYFWVKSWMGVGYFTPDAEVKPLLHTWSLAVEEQFYLFFPLLLLALKRFARHYLVPAIGLCGVLSFGLSVYCSYYYASANFYFLPPRAWELLVGAFLAATPGLVRSAAGRLAELLSWVGLLAILVAVFCYGRDTRFPGAAALLPCLGAAGIIWANTHTLTSVGRLLALRPVVFIGLISYSLYLWHWPVLVFFKYWAIDPVSPGRRFLLLLASLGLAVLSWKYVETPFRQRVILQTRKQIFSFAGVTMAILLLAGLGVFALHGVPARIPPAALRFIKEEPKVTWDHDVSLKEAMAGDFIEVGESNKQKSITFLVWGDSHAMAILPIINALSQEYSVRSVAATHSATAPLIAYKNEQTDLEDDIAYNKLIVDFINSKHIPNVILVARWDKVSIDGLSIGMVATLNALRNSGSRIWIMREIPIQHWNVPVALASAVWHGRDINKMGLPSSEYLLEYQRQNPIFDGLTREYPNVRILDPVVFFLSSNNRYSVVRNGQALYCDDHHISTAGAMLLRPLFEPIFSAIKMPSKPIQ